ncbi:hypothetical protein RIF29_06831 [Crotalaria pallida]|uniref:Uncharacterized protein n=1 Tax=Crotalaria pallida TaxID=3830 RepID=A0AAN9PBR1_CROPI
MGTQNSKFSNGVGSNRNDSGRFDGRSCQSSIKDNPDRFLTPPSVRKFHVGKSVFNCKNPSPNDENIHVNLSGSGSCKSSVTHNSDHFLSPPSIRKFQVGRSVLKCKTQIPNDGNIHVNLSGSGSCKSNVTHNSAILVTPPSVTKLQPENTVLKSSSANNDNGDLNITKLILTPVCVSTLQSRNNLLKCKRTNSDIRDKGVISDHFQNNRSVLSDITNISHSTKQCSRDFDNIYQRDGGITAREVQKKRRVPFSSQNLDELKSWLNKTTTTPSQCCSVGNVRTSIMANITLKDLETGRETRPLQARVNRVWKTMQAGNMLRCIHSNQKSNKTCDLNKILTHSLRNPNNFFMPRVPSFTKMLL